MNDLYKNTWNYFEKEIIRPIIFKKLSIKEADRAHNIMEKNENIGKIILKFINHLTASRPLSRVFSNLSKSSMNLVFFYDERRTNSQNITNGSQNYTTRYGQFLLK